MVVIFEHTISNWNDKHEYVCTCDNNTTHSGTNVGTLTTAHQPPSLVHFFLPWFGWFEKKKFCAHILLTPCHRIKRMGHTKRKRKHSERGNKYILAHLFVLIPSVSAHPLMVRACTCLCVCVLLWRYIRVFLLLLTNYMNFQCEDAIHVKTRIILYFQSCICS